MADKKEEMILAQDDIFDEATILLHVRKWRWVSCKIGSTPILQMNWVVSALASILLLTFVIIGAVDSDMMVSVFKNKGQPWITQNFTWLYILTQDVWVTFLFYICFSKYGDLKLGKANEKPRYNDLTWFAMIFCCGIAVGFFLFGVGEPLYYYRQPTYWKGWAYDYNLNKIQVNDDDDRANQSIFMCFFHWGVHGWIPYILMAVNIGVTSHRWGLPMTIRSAFYPLVGEHIYSFLGDIIDATSMACTTFGVCTSLGLGVSQLAAGMQYQERYYTGGVQYLVVDTGFLVGLIIAITVIACISVLSGLRNGLKNFSQLAMSLCLVIGFFVMFADNTTYILNIFTQNIGYYLQYVLQAGFDCEAFQQLAYEFDSSSSNLLWGSDPNNLMAKLASKGLAPPLKSADCGAQENPCNSGEITAAICGMNGAIALSAYGVDAASRAACVAVFAAFPSASSIPCGSGWNSTYVDTAATILGSTATTPLSVSYPSTCPTSTFESSGLWGTCSAYKYNGCSRMQAFGESTNVYFMDWWTVFYWGWWVSWGPFVGIFMATISRGRTIRNMIMGGFIFPCLFSFFWFSIFGGVAIKMERIAEYVLNVKPDWLHGTINCAPHYGGGGFPDWSTAVGTPLTDEAIKLNELGYTMLTCQPFVTQIYDVMKMYPDWAPFLWILCWVALFFYFITSSDSGSYVDDLLGASGLSKPPALQKIYWAWTEGLVAAVLVASGGTNFSLVLKGLRSVSICAGFPLTVFMCLMVPSTYRALKFEYGEEDIIKSKKFNVQLFDFFELYKPFTETPYSGAGAKQATNTLMMLFAPGVGVYKSLGVVPRHEVAKITIAIMSQTLWLTWFILQICEVGVQDAGSMSWVAFVFFVMSVGYSRWQVRQVYNVWGSLIEDLWVALMMYPFVLNQTSLMVENNGEGAPAYFTDLKAALELHEKHNAGATVASTGSETAMA